MAERVPYATPAERAAARDALRAHLGAGGLVVYPTETVYGIGGLVRADALAALASVKGERPFLLLVSGPDQPAGLRWTPEARVLAERFWPGPLTLALDAGEARLPAGVTGPDGAVAVRRSPHPAVAALLEAAGGPVTSTSANAPGRPPAITAEDALRVAEALPDAWLLDGGPLPAARPSTIVRCGAEVRLIREGAVSRRQLEQLVELR